MRAEVAIFVAIVAYAAGELVYLNDLNEDHAVRNLNFGLPETLKFNLRHAGGDLELNLQENKRLNKRAPVYVKENGNIVVSEVTRNDKLKLYQDRRNGAYFTGTCENDPHGPCTRKITGNLFIGGDEYKLEPATADKRTFSAHLGSAHNLEKLQKKSYGDAKVAGNVVASAEMDFAIAHPAELSHDVVSANEELVQEKKAALLKDLLQRLDNLKDIKKRQAGAGKTLHRVEMLVVLDHVIYEQFADMYSGDLTILMKIREYFSHIVNGVDLQYASIDESDIEFYVTIAAFYVSKTESDSVWMDYSAGQPDGLEGLQNMMDFRKKTEFPDHDHAALITGANFYYGGSSGVVGLAYLNGVCNDYRVSVNEEYGFFEGAGVLAHEVGHNLGAPHDDGASDGPCDPSRQFIMAPYVAYVSSGSSNIEPWRFSDCSVDSFRTYVNGMGSSSCTLKNGDIYDEDEFNDFTDNLGGAEYTEDEQCEILLGDGATMCDSNKDTESVCRNFECKSSGSTSCQRFVPAAGTSCGNNKMCFEGVCQAEECKGRQCDEETTTDNPFSTSTTSPDNSFFCYDAGIAGYSCAELTKLFGNSKQMCAKFARDCCETCTVKKNCKKEKPVKLGKQKNSCSTLVNDLGFDVTCALFTGECCKTCAP